MVFFGNEIKAHVGVRIENLGLLGLVMPLGYLNGIF